MGEILQAAIFILVLICTMILLAQFVANLNGYGEDYKYKFSEQEQTEYYLMPLCYSTELNIDAIAVNNQSLEEWCAIRYGSLDNLYGEKIK